MVLITRGRGKQRKIIGETIKNDLEFCRFSLVSSITLLFDPDS